MVVPARRGSGQAPLPSARCPPPDIPAFTTFGAIKQTRCRTCSQTFLRRPDWGTHDAKTSCAHMHIGGERRTTRAAIGVVVLRGQECRAISRHRATDANVRWEWGSACYSSSSQIPIIAIALIIHPPRESPALRHTRPPASSQIRIPQLYRRRRRTQTTAAPPVFISPHVCPQRVRLPVPARRVDGENGTCTCAEYELPMHATRKWRKAEGARRLRTWKWKREEGSGWFVFVFVAATCMRIRDLRNKRRRAYRGRRRGEVKVVAGGRRACVRAPPTRARLCRSIDR
ncbi:hypothetical protein B0H16DRAFT_357898 [Mycena metata]|uniref:Uncharacterized protein n=1 Tax=Mycena metata TaxID=1033252 RepID=A0AAD7MM45_9AGAR|nr:hypothetical protein B0H16DRAFT_357898 [Mycena metata]